MCIFISYDFIFKKLYCIGGQLLAERVRYSLFAVKTGVQDSVPMDV